MYAWAAEALRRLGQPLPDVDRDRATRALEAARAARHAGHPLAARPDLIDQLAHTLHAD